MRPAVALSEMADTVSSNVGTLKDASRNLDEGKIVRKVEKMENIVKMFNTPSELAVTTSDVHQLLKYAMTDDDKQTDDTFDQMEHVGMLLHVIHSHQKQLRSLVRNPIEYSRKCLHLPLKHNFKLNPTLKMLKSWWASEMVTAESKATAISSSRRRNLLADLGSDRDSDNETTSRQKKRAKANCKKSLRHQPRHHLPLVMKNNHLPKNQRLNEKQRSSSYLTTILVRRKNHQVLLCGHHETLRKKQHKPEQQPAKKLKKK